MVQTRFRFLGTLTVVAASALLLASDHANADEIQVGLAQVDITPPVGGRTTGYSSAKPTVAVHDPLSARVLMLQQNETTVALVVWDLCIVNSPWLFEQAKGLGIDHLLLANIHTHAGPRLQDMDFPSPENPWRQVVEKRVLETIKKAQQDLFPARFAAGEGKIRLGYNRLVRQEGGYALTQFENPNLQPYGPVDTTVGLLRITDTQDQVRAVLVNYACHPVVLGPRNRQISADFPGVMRNLVEETLPADAICFFIQGCCGDINPLRMARGDDRSTDFQVVQQVGSELAKEVIQILARIQTESGKSDSLSVAASTIDFESRWTDADNDADNDANNDADTITLGVTSLLVNKDIAIMTMPGEPFHRFQNEFRDKSGTPHALLFAYCCNGPYAWPSYLPDIESAAYGGYGASDTTKAEVGAGERLVHRGLVQLYQLQGRLKNKPVRHIQ